MQSFPADNFSSNSDRPMTIKRLIHAALGMAVLPWFTGCASIMSGRHADVAINSNPSNAHVVIRDQRGQEVAAVNTPGKVALKRNERFIFPARYTATIEAPGYHTATIPIRSTINPWILGNVVVGGLVGLAVDNVTGAAWKPRDTDIYHELTPIYTARQPGPSSDVQPAQYGAESSDGRY
jgi:hypothetical protein